MKNCLHCNAEFAGHPNRKHCSLECRIKYGNGLRPKNRPQPKRDPEDKRIKRKAYRETHKLLGLCKHCTRPANTDGQCDEHRDAANYREKLAKSKRQFGALWEHHRLIINIETLIKETTTWNYQQLT